jgi:hypothetical protein
MVTLLISQKTFLKTSDAPDTDFANLNPDSGLNPDIRPDFQLNIQVSSKR